MIHRLLGDRGWWHREERLQSAESQLRALAQSPVALFLPNHRTGRPLDTWWYLRPQLLCEMLGVLGFTSTTLSYSEGALFNGVPQRLFTIVGRRS
jgi:hypothetical protein